MLPRVLEPEVMDTSEEARDYDAMDHSAVNHLFAEEFREVWDGNGPILDVGTGTAQIPIEICRQYAESNAATGGQVADELVGVFEQLDGLLQVDDVDPVALREDVGAHLRVPALLLVAEVDACLQQPGDDRSLALGVHRARGVLQLLSR